MRSRTVHTLFIFFVFIFSFSLVSQFGKHFFFPFSYLSGIRIDYLAPTVYFIDILSFILFFIWFFQSHRHFYQLKKWVIQYKLPVLTITFLLTLNLTFSLVKPIWLYGFARLLQGILLFLFFLQQGNKRAVYSGVVWGLLLGSCFELTLSLMQLSARHSIQGWWYYLGERSFSIFTPGIAKAYFMGKEFLRPYGTFSHPNSLGGFYLLIYVFILTQKRITNGIVKGFFLFTSSALVIISFSRTAIAMYVMINLLYFSRNYISCKICFFSKVCVAFILIIISFNISGDLNSFQKRGDFFEKSLSIITDKPFTGTGIGSYLIAQHQYPQKFSTFFEQPVHNIFLLLIAQLGIPLSVLILFFIYRYIKKKLKKIEFLLPIFCILVTGNIDHYWITLSQNVLVLAVIFGILFSYEKTPSRN